MSNVGQAASAVVGGVVGFVVGGPTGAAYGFQLGLMAGQLISPTRLPPVVGPRLEDFQTTTAQLGGAVFITYGTIAVPGTVLWLAPVREVTESEEVGGKGGGGEQTVTTYSYFQSVAYGLCEGVIAGILRIWENGKLVYDMRPQQPGETSEAYIARQTAAAEYEQTFVLYLGTETQEPDPTIELLYGEGNVPAFRGLAYIVYPDRQLRDDQARRHPNFRFEVYHEPGTTDPLVYLPEYIAGGSDSGQNTDIGVDWTNDRYIVYDGTGDGPWLRASSIQYPPNKEYVQRSFDDYPAGYFPNDTVYALMAGKDGFFYVSGLQDFGDDTIFLYKLDPLTLDVVASISTLSSFAWSSFSWLTLNVTRGERTEHVIFNVDVFSSVSFAAINTTDGMREMFVQTIGREYGTCCLGQSGDGYATVWVQISGDVDSLPAQFYRVTFTIPPDDPITGAQQMSYAVEEIFSLSPQQIDDFLGSPSLGLATFADSGHGMYLDPADDCLVFSFSCSLSGPDLERYIKVDPDTAEIVWISDDIPSGFGAEIQVKSTGQSVVSRSTGYMLSPLNTFSRSIDFSNGDFGDAIDFADQMGDYNGFEGQMLFNATRGLIITQSTGNTLGNDSHGWIVLNLKGDREECVTLAEIVEDVCNRCGLTDAQLDTSDLDICIHGYALTRNMPGREAIEPLRPIGPFDAVESGEVIKFPTRGKAGVATLSLFDMGVHEAGGTPPPALRTTKLQDVELPRQVRLKYIAHTRDYEPGEQTSPVRLETDAVNDVNIEVPVAFLTDQQALQTAEVAWADAWASRWKHSIVVDQSYSHLEPADAIGVPVDGRIERLRIVSIDEVVPLLRRLELVRDDDGSYESYAIATAPQLIPTAVTLYADTVFELLDLPPLRDEDDDAGVYVAAWPATAGRTWGGAVLFKSTDGGATYANWGSITRAATAGTVNEALPEGITTTWDFANELVVDLDSGALESREAESDLYNGANAAVIGAHGRWEIVQFQYAELISPNRWRLTKLLRGRRATEHHVGTSVAGDRFILISNGALIRLLLQASEISQERTYRAVTIGRTFDGGTEEEFTGAGQALEPFSPVHIEGTRDVDGDLTITWIRRGRLGQELPGDADVPLSEETESYEVDIVELGSPDAVVRTISASTQTATYTAAQQIADQGFLRDSVFVRVYQLSAITGRGTPGEATL